jgi:hypothetical protein
LPEGEAPRLAWEGKLLAIERNFGGMIACLKPERCIILTSIESVAGRHFVYSIGVLCDSLKCSRDVVVEDPASNAEMPNQNKARTKSWTARQL